MSTRPPSNDHPHSMRAHLLGPFEITGPHEVMDTAAWRSQQNRTILKVLLIHRRHVVTPDQLLDILWPDEAPDVTRPRLYVRISQIRRMLDPEHPQGSIQSLDGGYRFEPDPGWWIDADLFEAAAERGRRAQEDGALAEAIEAYEEAHRLYRGDLLEADRYADWAFAERERLLERYLTMVTELAEAYAQQGRYRRAISLYQDILRRDPYREAIFVRLMLAYYYAGEQVQALRTFERCRRVLAEDMGVTPLPSTRTLAARIEDGTLWADETFPRYPPPAYRGRLFEIPYSLGHTPFVGRDREYAWLISRYREARPGLVLVEGEAGVGKTRLIEEVLGFVEKEEARSTRARVLRASLSSEGTALPYAPLIDALRPLWHPEEVSELTGSQQGVLTAFFAPPARSPGAPPQRQMGPSPHAIEDAVAHWLEAHVPPETLLFVDDAPRLDGASLGLMLHLSRVLTVIATGRTDETPPDHPLHAAFHTLASEGYGELLQLNRLASPAVEAFIRRLAQRSMDALYAELMARTDGNPLFLIAALQALFENGTLHVDEGGRWAHSAVEITVPSSVRGMIEQRLQRLDREQRRVFDAAAVIGEDFDFALLQQIVQRDETPLFNTLDTLLGAGLIVEPRARTRGEFAPAHALYVEVAQATLPRVRWRQLNGRVGDALQTLHPDDPTLSARLAHHYHEAGRTADAVPHAILAGELALNRYALAEACSHFEHAAQWAEEADWTPEPSLRAQLHAGWAEALRRSAQPDAALAHYAEALPGAEGLLALHLIYQMAALQTTHGSGPETFARLAETLDADAQEPWILGLIHCAQGFWAALRGDPTRARQCAAAGWGQLRHTSGNDAVPPWVLSRATIILARTHALWGEWHHVRRYAAKALIRNRAYHDAYGAADAHATLAQACYGLRKNGKAQAHAEEALRRTEEAGDLRLQGKALHTLGQVLLDEGRPTEVQQVIRRLLDIAEQTGDLEAQAWGGLLKAELLMRMGKTEAARSLLTALLGRARAVEVPAYVVAILHALTRAHVGAGAYDDARSTVTEALALAERCRMRHQAAPLRQLAARIEQRERAGPK